MRRKGVRVKENSVRVKKKLKIKSAKGTLVRDKGWNGGTVSLSGI